jgi:hypothetical protein
MPSVEPPGFAYRFELRFITLLHGLMLRSSGQGKANQTSERGNDPVSESITSTASQITAA